jgi:spermidine/putrescine transport system permease protein
LPGVVAAFTIVFIPTLGDYATPALVGGLASTMIGNLIQAQFSSVNDWPFGCALAVLVMLLLVPPALAVAFLGRHRR